MRFVDFLRATVLLSAAAATVLGVIAVIEAADPDRHTLLAATGGWWLVAAALGGWLGRGGEPNRAIATLLGQARFSPALPPLEPGRVLLNRLWPLLVLTIIAGGLALILPQLPAIGAGFALLYALAWRRQHAAVEAVERRDGVQFFVVRTPPLRPIALQRTPGFRAVLPDQTAQL
jgi:hypothetical protein